MPSKYVIRSFIENTYYHVFNRGIEKRKIFEDGQDYRIFIYYLFVYLSPLDKVLKAYPKLRTHLKNKNLNKELELVAYCLMPNHFHFLIKQKSKDAISRFMKQLANAYTVYFNNKSKRVGALMQGRFKAALIDSNEILIHISRYIHLNPLAAGIIKGNQLDSYKWSSYPYYLNNTNNDLCNKNVIMNNFNSSKNYEQFVLDQASYSKELNIIKHLAMDD